jgi:hypothetical protein
MTNRTRLLLLPFSLLAFACTGRVETLGPSAQPVTETDETFAAPDSGTDAPPPQMELTVDDPAINTLPPPVPAVDSGTPPVDPVPPTHLLLDPMMAVQGEAGCVAWSSVRAEPFEAAVDAGQSLTTLQAAQANMVGSYVGHATSPWGEWDVLLTFGGNGHYLASSYDGTVSGSTPPPFYYGDPAICPSLDQWRLLDVAVTGAASGELDVGFSSGAPECHLPSWQGLLSQVSFDASGNRLHFDFATSDGYGPIVYDLWRLCPLQGG